MGAYAISRILTIGEILWDVFPDSERLGGASFNFSVNARRLGEDVVFLSAVGEDARGREARTRAAAYGLDPSFIQIVPGTSTGVVTVQVNAAGQPDFTIHRPAAYDRLVLNSHLLARLTEWNPDWIYFGTLHQFDPAVRHLTRRLIAALPAARKFYDVNLRRDCYSPELVLELLPIADAVKLNDEEVATVEAMAGVRSPSLAGFTEAWSQRMGWRAVAVTRGKDGCAVRIGHHYAEVPGRVVKVADTVGAGDAFAAAFWHGIVQSWDPAKVADFANGVGAMVASLPGALPEWDAH